MKVIYLLKKGLQCYPPCLTQILFLNDLKIDIEVYHGKNSNFVNELLDGRGIIHHTFQMDRDNKNIFESALNFISFGIEAKKIQKSFQTGTILWIGNMETAMSLDIRKLKNSRFILNVLELYNEDTLYDKWLIHNAKYAEVIIACEKHRAAIMQSRYELAELPQILPNKPYEIEYTNSNVSDEMKLLLEEKFVVVYQGIISKDRPLEAVAKALAKYNDSEVVFLIMGACSEKYQLIIKEIYNNTFFTGFIPAPEHLKYTKYCNLGIANYDVSSLNNVFCAPNKIFEYAKYGIPMLCSKNIALEETVGYFKAGCCIDFNDVDCIVESISEIKTNFNEYSGNAEVFYENCNMKSLIEQIVRRITLKNEY